MSVLNESGLQKNDLDYLILPLVEIDAFESKISNKKAVVIAFYVFEKDPAKDLERFIEKSDVDILDTETSPSPTEDGYYVVFVEMNRDQNLPEIVDYLIDQISNLTNVDQWQFKTINDDEIHDLNEENLREYVNLDPAMVPDPIEPKDRSTDEETSEEGSDEDESAAEDNEEEPSDRGRQDDVAESAIPILRNGLMESIEVRGDMLALRSRDSSLYYRVTVVSESEPSVPIIGLEIGNPLIREAAMLSRMLGSSYAVNVIDGGLLVESVYGYLILETVD